jgi:carbamoyltransferase
MSFVVGISAYYHDSSVALVEDGKLLDFAKEEWLTRVKGDRGFPSRALRLITKRWSLNEENVETIVFYERPFTSWLSIVTWCSQAPIKRWKLAHTKLSNFFDSGVFVEAELKWYFKKAKVVYVDHHLSHARNAIAYSRVPDDCIVLVLDSFGDGYSGGVYDARLNCLRRFKFPHSLGIFYSAITDYCGFLINEGESKLMGLAALGEPVFVEILREFLTVKDGIPILNLDFFRFHEDPNRHFSDFGLHHLPNLGSDPLSPDTFQITANLAASAQFILEETLFELVRFYTEGNRVAEVVLSGGIALNVSAVSKLAEKYTDLIFTAPASPGDSGSAIGAALQVSQLPEVRTRQYLFPGKRTLDFSHVRFEKLLSKIAPPQSMIPAACSLLVGGHPVALMTSNIEVGPRALGATSILFHSREPDARKIFNDRVKGRETYRPLAPAVLDRNFSRFFECSPNIRHLLRYMGALAFQTEEFEKLYPGYSHADGTCRVQIVDEEASLLYRVLEEFECQGEYVLINTSLNVGGDPMAYDEVDLITSLKRMKMSYLLTDAGLYALVE